MIMDFDALFKNINSLNIAVIGDFCLDAYWLADMQKSVLSRETPHFPLPVISERYSPGAAGNVARCVKTLSPSSVKAIGIIGDDWRGKILKGLLDREDINTDGIFVQKDIFTNAYIKPVRKGISDVAYEDPRIDFENYNNISKQAEDKIIDYLDKQADLDALLVCDQMICGCITDRVRNKITSMAKQGLFVIADSRNNISKYKYAFIKPNDFEAKKAAGKQDEEKAAIILSEMTKKPVIVTLGERGCLTAVNGKINYVEAVETTGAIDIVGAGDAFMSAFALAYKATEDLVFSCKFANTASAVVIKKIGTTGTASREEIENIWNQPNFGV
jgi:rfaE bifunctional protein kinase chain/domain